MNDDLISKQGIIDELDKIIRIGVKDKDGRHSISAEMLKEFILSQPAKQSEQEIGQWISNRHTDTVLCSECKKCYGDESKFCPNCGAKMKRESED